LSVYCAEVEAGRSEKILGVCGLNDLQRRQQILECYFVLSEPAHAASEVIKDGDLVFDGVGVSANDTEALESLQDAIGVVTFAFADVGECGIVDVCNSRIEVGAELDGLQAEELYVELEV
jgi:hypothetical protein